MSYPTSPKFRTVDLKSENSSLMSETVSGKIQVRQLANQKWSFSAKYPPMTRAEFMPIYAFLMQQQGMYGTFTVQIPIMEDARGTASGTLRVNNAGGYAVGSSTITVDGITGTLLEGDLVKFTGHDKVYMVVSHTETSGNTTSIGIEPPLYASVANDSAISYDDVPMKVRLRNDVQEFNIRVDSLIEYEVDFVEVI
jgi:hypothetical protein